MGTRIVTSRVRFGFSAPQTRAEVLELEALGAASLWVGGHVASRNPSPEAMVWLARLVEQSETAMIGTAILLLPLYPPALVAKQIADLDHASGGRLTLGVGVGGEYPSDFAATEVPIEERGSRTNESIELLRRFWTGEPVSHRGAHHRYDELRIHPAPIQGSALPIVVSGRQPVAMRRAARLGDGWMPYLYSPERYASSVAAVRDEAKRIGRDLAGFAWFAHVFVSLDENAARARADAAAFLGGTYRSEFDAMVDRVACAGNPQQVLDRIRAFVDAGVEHFVFVPCSRPQDTAQRLLTEILPML